MDTTSAMLGNFLDEALSEANVGISPAIRAHLDRFRAFLLAFYSARLGHYPPPPDSTVYRAMGDDFALLYDLLKDETFTSDEMMPSVAAGGICALQLVQSLDARLGFEPLRHALLLLPQPEPKAKRVSWLARRGKSDTRHLEHAAMVRASNWREDVFQNDLVYAYRRFEENLVMSPSKADKQLRVSLADARKVRWILIYAVHQTLRHVNTRPPGVDDREAPYFLAAPIDSLPSWTQPDEEQIDTATEDMPFVTWDSTPAESPKGRIEIKPDIDYFALTHRESCSERRQSTGSVRETLSMQRSGSVNRLLGSGSPLRSMARKLRQAKPPTPASPCQPLYHEIVVHGYGNGTNDVGLDAVRVKWASRSDSTASQACSSASSALTSATSPVESVATAMTTPGSSPSPGPEASTEAKRWSQQEAVSSPPASPAGSVAHSSYVKKRSKSTAFEGFNYARCLGQFVEQESRMRAGISRRHTTASDPRRQGSLVSQAWPTIDEEPCVLEDTCDWTAMQAFLDGRTGDGNAGDVPAWEQYADLGGLTEMR